MTITLPAGKPPPASRSSGSGRADLPVPAWERRTLFLSSLAVKDLSCNPGQAW